MRLSPARLSLGVGPGLLTYLGSSPPFESPTVCFGRTCPLWKGQLTVK